MPVRLYLLTFRVRLYTHSVRLYFHSVLCSEMESTAPLWNVCRNVLLKWCALFLCNQEKWNAFVMTNTLSWKNMKRRKIFCDDEHTLSSRNTKHIKSFCDDEHRAFGPINLYGGLSIKVGANSGNKERWCRNKTKTQRGENWPKVSFDNKRAPTWSQHTRY